MESNKMYRFARKLLDGIIKASESERGRTELVRKAIAEAKLKLAVLDEFDSTPGDLSVPSTPPMPEYPRMPLGPIQMSGTPQPIDCKADDKRATAGPIDAMEFNCRGNGKIEPWPPAVERRQDRQPFPPVPCHVLDKGGHDDDICSHLV